MITLLSANILEIAVGAVVVLVVAGGFGAYLYRKIKAKKSGKGNCCSGDCSCCSCCSFSLKPQKKDDCQDNKDIENKTN